MASERIRIGESISGRVAESGQAIITADSATNALTLPAHRLSVRADRTGALMCVPIKVESRLLGTLHIFRERGYHFNEEALRIAMSLADQAAIAIENAQLFAEIHKQTTQLEQTNVELQREIVERQRAEEALHRPKMSWKSASRAYCRATAGCGTAACRNRRAPAYRARTAAEPKKWRKVPIGPRVNFSPT